jgi:Tol biopolymer transport system component
MSTTGHDRRAVRRGIRTLPLTAGVAFTITLFAACSEAPEPTGPAGPRDPAGLRPLAAVASATNGKIAFASDRDGFDMDIYVMNADGSSVVPLTSNDAFDGEPAWSPDGTKLVFQSTRDSQWELYVMNADGSGQTRLTNNLAIDGEPVWSPDGTKIAYHTDRDGNFEVYVMNADGSGQTRLTNNPANDAEPAWSPDGTKLAFVSNRDPGQSGEIYTMNADGTAQTRLTIITASDHGPAWSPDGTKIAFYSGRDGADDVYVMNVDGSGQTRLTNDPAFDRRPVWSPDGTKIAFESNRDGNPEGAPGGTPPFDIHVMNADGSAQTNLTNTSSRRELWPAWQPLPAPQPPTNGKIAFMSLRGNRWDTFVINADGSGETRVGQNLTDNFHPFWSPDGTKLAFQSTNAVGDLRDIFVMNADGSGRTNLTNNPVDDEFPAWSPTGTKIAFSSGRVEGSGIYVMNADGSGQTNLTNYPAADWGAAWSPDGTKIAFHTNRHGPEPQIYVINADGTGLTRLTNNTTHNNLPAWSPDGTKIAFGRYLHPYFQIHVMNVDGSGATNISNHASDNGNPAWSPDGTKIVFESSRDGKLEIYVMNADGSGQTRVTNNPAAVRNGAPTWQPLPTLPQAITFTSAPPGNAAVGGTYTMSATGGASGHPVIFSSLTRSVCAVNGSVATFVAAGSCTVAAEQAGNAVYLPAPRPTQTFAVAAPAPGATPVGSNVTVEPLDETTGQPSPVSITFSQVTAAGTTTVTSGTIGDGSGPPPPSGFRLGNPSYYFDMTTTATFSGPVTVCIDYTGTTFVDLSSIRMLHGDGAGGWADVTTSNDLPTQTVCGSVSSLSPFVLAEPKAAQSISFTSAPPNPGIVGETYLASATGGGSGNSVVFSSLTQGVCTVAGSTASLVAVGTCTVAANQTGNATHLAAPQATQSFDVVYPFTGFFQPVDNPPVANQVTAGRAIPVTFSLGGNRGLGIFAAGYPTSGGMTCDSSQPIDNIEQTVTAGGSSLSYDAATDTYTYVWKTDKAWANSCRRFTVRLTDGTDRWADFRFTK